ncbi:hypothetical protein KCU65_g373, partial [Aureobasidium melanogenum]
LATKTIEKIRRYTLRPVCRKYRIILAWRFGGTDSSAFVDSGFDKLTNVDDVDMLEKEERIGRKARWVRKECVEIRLSIDFLCSTTLAPLLRWWRNGEPWTSFPGSMPFDKSQRMLSHSGDELRPSISHPRSGLQNRLIAYCIRRGVMMISQSLSLGPSNQVVGLCLNVDRSCNGDVQVDTQLGCVGRPLLSFTCPVRITDMKNAEEKQGQLIVCIDRGAVNLGSTQSGGNFAGLPCSWASFGAREEHRADAIMRLFTTLPHSSSRLALASVSMDAHAPFTTVHSRLLKFVGEQRVNHATDSGMRK